MANPLIETDIKRVELLASQVFHLSHHGYNREALYEMHVEIEALAFSNFVVIYGREKTMALLDALKYAIDDLPIIEQMHDSFLMTLDLKQSLDHE